MARIRKTIKVDDKEITIKELTVQDILDVGELITGLGGDSTKGEASGDAVEAESDASPTTVAGVKDILDKHLHLAVDGITVPDLIKMAPSELKQIYDAFREVNAVFFVVAHQMGLEDLVRTLKETVQQDFLRLLAAL